MRFRTVAATTFRIQNDLDQRVARKLSVLLVGEDWRTRRFIRTVLKYATEAAVMEAPYTDAAAFVAREAERPIDLLIVDVESDDAAAGIEEIREIAAANPSMKVLLMSFRDDLACEIPAGWRYLSIPFPTTDFVDCVAELSRSASSRSSIR
ncbi:MAG TPA: hypothetical protein VMA31_11750 [Bryobacteraceae bacterium]|nr:hypothetical protein [Bryobacteraceae bacterium]